MLYKVFTGNNEPKRLYGIGGALHKKIYDKLAGNAVRSNINQDIKETENISTKLNFTIEKNNGKVKI